MCRLLYIKSEHLFETAPHLEAFARVARNSREYQGHGWGCACHDGEEWSLFRSVNPIWDADFTSFQKAKVVYAHARSAFRNEGIMVENNMPFINGDELFIFNGELHGVRQRSEGRTGAEKIFNLIRRFNRGDRLAAMQKTVDILCRRTERIRAMNVIMGDHLHAVLCSLFDGEADYFTLWEKHEDGFHCVCSKPYPTKEGWSAIENRTIQVVGESSGSMVE